MMLVMMLICGCNDCFIIIFGNEMSKIVEFVVLIVYLMLLIFLVFDVFGFFCIVVFLFLIFKSEWVE